MAFTSFSFLGLVLATVLLANALPAPKPRAWVVLGASVLYVASHVQAAAQVLPLAAFVTFGYAGVELSRRVRSKWVPLGLLGITLVSFVVLKRYSFVPDVMQLPGPYLLVGLSYVLFRVVHLLIDAQQGELEERVPPLAFATYCLGFLTFTAGPVQRYQDFAAARQQPHRLDEPGAEAALTRVVVGFVKVAVVSALLNRVFELLSARLLEPAVAWGAVPLVLVYGLAAALYTGHLYANFSGYVDVVLGVGLLIGWPLPENFNRPFAARSFLELWSRWHMTLSNWFKTYLFNPLLKALTTRWPASRGAPYLATLAFFVTFLVMGLWHGATAVFVVYGLLLGAGASVNKGFQIVSTKRLGKQRYKALGERPVVAYASRGMTFAYFALALTCFWVDLAQLESLTGRLGPGGVVAAYVGLSVVSAAGFWLADASFALLSAARGALGAPLRLRGVRDLGRALLILLVVAVGSFFQQAPNFVYRAF
jgi:alginate O-acetyltransferase complex protein AlgI